MSRALIAALLAMLPLQAVAQGQPSQLEALVASELHHYTNDATVDDLNNSQLAQIYSIMHSNRSEGDKRRLIQSAIGGRNTLRGLLFN